MKTLPVLFRVTPEFGVTAYFPTLRERNLDVTCYAHLGQHDTAHPAMMREGRRATPAEYADLLAELRGYCENPHYGEPVRLAPRLRAPPFQRSHLS